jgi:alkanesulfonate monooxygenase SsuD/methylene tetrahydromethanopterin reductase-like flavin-dependent oxidoreductase (luciferase family)
MPLIEEGLKLSGRSLNTLDVAAYLLISVDKNEKSAIDAAKRFVAQKLPTRHSDMLRHAGVSVEEIDRVKNNVERLGVEKAALEVDDDVVRKVTIAGMPEHVVAGLKEFVGTGLNLPIAWEIIGPDRHQSLDLLATEVVPKL